MRFGIDVAQQRITWQELVERVQIGERLGFEGAFGFDHYQPMFGSGPGNCFEGMTTLAGLAGLTQTIRLGLLVAGVTYRHPSVYTCQAITLDHISNGRFEMSFGAAWFEPEHKQLGIGFPKSANRFDLLEDSLEIVTRLMSGEVVDYVGKTTSLNQAQLLPRPLQRPHPPIWIGGSGPNRTLPLVARFGDVWHCFEGPSSLENLGGTLDSLATEVGRDPRSITRSSSISISANDNEIRKLIAQYERAGVEYLVCSWPTQGAERVEEFAIEIMSQFK